MNICIDYVLQDYNNSGDLRITVTGKFYKGELEDWFTYPHDVNLSDREEYDIVNQLMETYCG